MVIKTRECERSCRNNDKGIGNLKKNINHNRSKAIELSKYVGNSLVQKLQILTQEIVTEYRESGRKQSFQTFSKKKINKV